MKLKYVDKTTMIAEIDGELDHHNAVRIREKLDHEIMAKHINRMVFDFSKLTFMDSSGIGVIIGRYKKLKGVDGKVCIVTKSSNVSKLLKLSGLVKLMPVYGSVNQALKKI